jgi:hypothetical protein
VSDKKYDARNIKNTSERKKERRKKKEKRKKERKIVYFLNNYDTKNCIVCRIFNLYTIRVGSQRISVVNSEWIYSGSGSGSYTLAV